MEERVINSSLKFINYIVNKVKYEAKNAQDKETSWKLEVKVNNKTMINEEKNKMTITLTVKVFEGVENAPFYIEVTATGYFELIGDDDISKYEANAIAIMYPYLRAIVSNYTSSANVAPLILPAINVNAMLKNNKEENEEN